MNKFIIYGLLLLTYLGLSKSLSPNEYGIKYVNSNKGLAELIPGTTISVILVDIHSTGFIIKTYYQKYKIIYGFQSYEELIIRTSRGYMQKNMPYLGMSVLRRFRDTGEVSFTPLPPGSIFLGNKNFGNWIKKGPNQKIWRFFRVYRQIPKYLGWKHFIPSQKIHSEINAHKQKKTPYFGDNNQFGLEGHITKLAFPNYFERINSNKINMKDFLKDYFKENFIK